MSFFYVLAMLIAFSINGPMQGKNYLQVSNQNTEDKYLITETE